MNVCGAGVCGATAAESLGRMERDVFPHEPDLVIVCFGLNGVARPLGEYTGALRTILHRCREGGIEVVFMTPNMLNTRVAEDTDPAYLAYAHVTAGYQNGGRMDRYVKAACDVAGEEGVPVADAYAEWKNRSEDEDVTLLLTYIPFYYGKIGRAAAVSGLLNGFSYAAAAAAAAAVGLIDDWETVFAVFVTAAAVGALASLLGRRPLGRKLRELEKQ